MKGIIKEDILFGKIALLNNIITQDQLEKALEIQKKKEKFSPISIILLNEGYITEEQFRLILETQKKRLPKPVISPQERRDDFIFAYLCVKNNYTNIETIYECLEFQNRLAKKGLLFRLSEILINKNIIKISQAKKILEIQNKKILRCKKCGTYYNTLGIQISIFECKRCGEIIEIPPKLINKGEALEIEKFKKDLEYLMTHKKTKEEVIEEDYGEALIIVSNKFSENRIETKDEDIYDEEEYIEVAYGKKNIIKKLLELDFFEYEKNYISQMDYLPFLDEKNLPFLDEKIGKETSDEDIFIEEILENEIIAISGLLLAKKYLDNS